MRPSLILVAVLGMSVAFAGEASQVAPASQKIQIDGNIDAAEWAGITAQPLPHEIDPLRVAPTSWQTTLRVSHDGSNLLLAIEARDEEPDRIVASRGARDSIGSEDYVVVMIDAEGNRQRHYEFSVNAAGTVEDSIVGGAASGSPQWSGAWEAAVQRTATGYSVEMSIPLTTLNASVDSGQDMSLPMNVTRHIGRDRHETLALLPVDTRLICQECQYEVVTLAGLAADRQSLTLRPYVAAHRSTRYPAGASSNSDSSIDPGIDLLWQLGGGRKVVATVNPDFSEVAPDQIQFDVNRRFAVTFTENRPFFTENSGVFGTTLPLVYTRSISDPSAAVAYSSASGQATTAALYARDRATSFIVPGQNRSRLVALDGESETFLGRLQRNGDGRRIGMLLTGRHGDDYDYQLAAVDGRATIGERQSLEAIVAFSHASLGSDAAADNFLPEDSSGGMLRITHNYKNGPLGIFSAMNRSTPDFRADTGNQSRVGITHVHHEYFWSLPQAPGGRLSNISGGIWGNYADFLHDGGHDGNVEIWGNLNFAGGSSMDAHVHGTVEAYQGREYRLYDIGGGYGWQVNESVRVNAGITSAEVIDFVGFETGQSIRTFTGFNVKLGATLSLSGNLNVDRTHGDTVRNFTTRSSLLRANWSPRLGHTVSLVGNWGATRTHMKLTNDPVERSDRLRGQVVYLYQRADRTAFHIGVNLGGAGTDGLASVRRTDELVFSKLVLNLDWSS